MYPIIRREFDLIRGNSALFANTLCFFGLVIFITPLGLPPIPLILAQFWAGLVWIAALLAGLLSVERFFFKTDFDDGTLEMLYLSPIPLESFVLAKAISHWLIIGMPITIAGIFGAFLFTPSTNIAIWSGVALGIGTPALSVIGAFGASLTLTVRRGGLLLSVLVLPMSIPVLVFGSQIIIRASEGGNIVSPLSLLLALSIASAGTLPLISATVLKMSLR